VPEIDVRVERVTKRFADVHAVDDLTLDIERGQFFSLLGPSGCGKTTTLRMIGGFEVPTSGSIYLGGKDVTDLPAYRRPVNTVFQSYALFPHLDVFDNVAFGLRRAHVDKGEIRRRVGEALDLVDLPGMERRRPSQLSGGQQQRISLARALINRPRVLLLDEPLGALDLKLRKHMQLELKRIQSEVGITFLYVTHDQEEAMTLSDRLAVMRGGRIEQIGGPQDVYERPTTEFVAGFLGASNLLAGKVREQRGDRTVVELADGTPVSVPGAEFPPGGRVNVGVRPEKVTLVTSPSGDIPIGGEIGAGDGWNCVNGILRVATYTGVSYQYVVDRPDGAEVTVYEQNLGAVPVPDAGTPVRLQWRPEHTFLMSPSDVPIEQEEP